MSGASAARTVASVAVRRGAVEAGAANACPGKEMGNGLHREIVTPEGQMGRYR